MAIASCVISPHTFWSILLRVALKHKLGFGCGRMTSATTAELRGWGLLSWTAHDLLGQERVLVWQLVPFERQLVHPHQVAPRHDVVPNQLCLVVADESRINTGVAALAHL